MTLYDASKAPICVCGEQMVERRNKATGQRFFGCKKFPRCSHTEEIDAMDEEDDEDIY